MLLKHTVARTQKIPPGCTCCTWRADILLHQADPSSTAVFVRGRRGTEPVAKALLDCIWLKEAEKGSHYESHKMPYLWEAVCLWKANLAAMYSAPEKEPAGQRKYDHSIMNNEKGISTAFMQDDQGENEEKTKTTYRRWNLSAETSGWEGGVGTRCACLLSRPLKTTTKLQKP